MVNLHGRIAANPLYRMVVNAISERNAKRRLASLAADRHPQSSLWSSLGSSLSANLAAVGLRSRRLVWPPPAVLRRVSVRVGRGVPGAAPAPALLRRAPPRSPPRRSRPRPAAGGLRAGGPSPPCSVAPRAPPPRAGVLGVRGVPFAALWGSPAGSLCARFARVAPPRAPVLACAVGGRSVGGAFRAPSGVFAARPPLRPRGSGLRSGLRSGL